MKRSFDRLSGYYQTLESLSFGSVLQKARESYLERVRGCKRGLLIGDGDGRFSAALLLSNPQIRIDSIDISPAMLAHAKMRAATNADRLSTIQADALAYEYPDNRYDFVGLHFCLDCFEQADVDELIPALASSLQTNGLLVYSDFSDRVAWQRLIVRLLYLFFRATTGLKVNRLPKITWEGFEHLARRESMRGLVFSELCRKRRCATNATELVSAAHSGRTTPCR